MMTQINMHKILHNEKALILACDHGLEHGPKGFNEKNIDSNYILDIALEGKFNGVLLHHGIAEKYYGAHYKDVPLILKLNGKTNIPHIDPISRQICTVERAIKLGAAAVAYTIYDGAPQESVMFQEFGKIVERAHDYGLPVVALMYPRGPFVKEELSTDILAYSARIGLELGADIIKMKYPVDMEGFKWVVKCAGRTKVVVAGMEQISEEDLLHKVYNILQTGVTGLAIGRNVWKNERPFS
ncbi:MAG: fructose-bisphosphate aldolase, partial [archaeon]